MEDFHLEFVPKDGTCLWESVLRCLNRPKEYQYLMLQRQVVLTATEHPDFFCDLLADHIKGQYGPLRLPLDVYKQREKDGTLTSTQKQDQFVPGPFSFVTYLEYLLKDGTWGDYGALLVISMMWQQKITVVFADSLHQQRIRHTQTMRNADIVLVFCNGNHYVPASKELR